MSADPTIITARGGRAALVAAFFALHIVAAHTAARAQVFGEMPSADFVSAPQITPVAAPAATPVATPAVVTPAVMAPGMRASQSVLTKPSEPAVSPPAPRQIACTAPAEFTHFDRPLVHTMRRLESGKPLTVVAIGSSSTAGARASSPAAAYPARLAVELKAQFPGHDITVLNRGVNGEVTEDMLGRFATDVIAAHPQLVLWQVGTNSVLRDNPLGEHEAELQQGIEQLKAMGADVVLVDLQYAPKVLAKSETPAMVEQIALTAKEQNVDLFRRFAVMRDWHDVQHIAFDVFVAPDELHMNDWGYACWAKLIGNAIAEAATRPIAAAAAHPTGQP